MDGRWLNDFWFPFGNIFFFELCPRRWWKKREKNWGKNVSVIGEIAINSPMGETLKKAREGAASKYSFVGERVRERAERSALKQRTSCSLP